MAERFEIVHFRMYDIGRSVDRAEAARLAGARSGGGRFQGRDTPDSLDLPEPLVVEFDRAAFPAGDGAVAASAAAPRLESLRLDARIFDDGVVSMVMRLEVACPLAELHRVRALPFALPGWNGDADGFIEHRFRELMGRIRTAVEIGQYRFEDLESEDYRAYCLVSDVGDPAGFVEAHRAALAAFLLGEDPLANLHEVQVRQTLGHPFSFHAGDLAIFDLDRCLIIDPRWDYEDVLLIVEHANFRMLELRTLDKLLGRRLDQAERDAARLIRRGRFSFRRAGFKLSDLQPLRIDALLILNGLENSSKIIGDFYLCQVYDHLCGLFNTGGWKANIERSLDTLQDIYSMAKGESNERALLVLEFVVVVLIAVELAIFLLAGT